MHRSTTTATTAIAALAGLALAAPTTAHADDKPWNAFEVTGTKVTGTTSPVDAPKLGVGQYTDTVPVAAGTRYYRVARSAGATIAVSVLARPAETATGKSDQWEYKLATLDGSTCDTESDSGSSGSGFTPLVGETLVQEADDDDCGKATDLVLAVKRKDGGQTPAATEIRVIEIPAVANIDSLPEPEEEEPAALRPPVGDAKEITGGTGLSTAAEVGTGTYVTKVVPGQLVFFKTHLDDGQRITWAVDGPTKDFTGWPDDYSSMTIHASGYNPLREELGDDTASYTKRELADDQVIAGGTVNFRNAQASPSEVQWAQLAGDYTFAFVVGRDGAMKTHTGEVPVMFSVRVDGSKVDGPRFVKGAVATSPAAGETASATPSSYEEAPAPDTAAKGGEGKAEGGSSAAAASGSAGGLPAGVWIGLGIAGLGVLAGLAYAITRRLSGPRA